MPFMLSRLCTGRASFGIGDTAVIVAVACPHRADAFAACRQIIDDLKHDVPIWESQLFVDGEAEWVGIGDS
jgi:molybdopterin synthase catalytic subunit